MLEIEAIRSRPRRTTLRAVVWTLAYVALVSMPVLVLASGLGGMPGSGWWFDFSMGLGFGALAVMGGQFVLTARFRRATAPIGMDVVYVFHRWLAVVGLALVLAHYALLRWHFPATLAPASPASAPFYMTAGRLALAVFAALIVSSLWRKRFGIEYGGWRIAHGVMALAGMVLAIIHVSGVGYYSGVFWSRVVIDAFLGSLVAIVVYVRLVKPLLVASRTYRVTAVRSERGHAHTLSIEPEGHAGLRFAPGQFGWLSLGVGPWRAREHPFSFSNSAEREGVLEFTIKALGDFTATVGETPIGTVAYVDGPHGIFSVDHYGDAPGFFFLAGGVGIAPIMSMLRTLADRGDTRPLVLVYGNRRWESVTFREELERLAQRLDLRTVHVLIEPPADWEGRVGMPDPEILRAEMDRVPEGSHCFLCGPVPMSEMAQRELRRLGVPMTRIHLEIFEMA